MNIVHLSAGGTENGKLLGYRIDLFGDAAFEPLTIANLREENERELALGFLRLLPDTDGTGRCNVDPSLLEGHEYEDENVA